MSFLIFGPEKPKLSFQQDPEKGAVIRCDNKYVLDYDPKKPITWRDIGKKFGLDKTCRTIAQIKAMDREKFEGLTFESQWSSVVEELKKLCQTDAERLFLTKFAEAQESWNFLMYSIDALKLSYSFNDWKMEAKEEFYKVVLDESALIPQVWVNWIHYDPRDKERAKRSRLEPFRVDFLRQGKIEGFVPFRRIVVEIDDIWHIADIEKNVESFLKSPEVKPSLGRFTEHLRKDRWLRHHGWEVCRFSTLEVEKEGSEYLFFEMLGIPGLVGIFPPHSPRKE